MIRSGALCLVEPLPPEREVRPDQVVLCTVRGRQYLHLVKAVKSGRYLIGNTRGGLNGWIQRRSIHGRLVCVESAD